MKQAEYDTKMDTDEMDYAGELHDVLLGKSSSESDEDLDVSADDEIVRHPLDDGIDSARFKKLQKKIKKQVSWAIRDFNMIEDGDVVMVCISGGKDSFTLLDILLFLQRIAPIHFEVVAVNLDQKQPNFPEEVLPRYLSERGIAYYILEKDTYSIVKSVVPEGKTYCSVCSRLRRGSLYGFAKQIGATKVALGHHRDDILATFFLNLFHGGSLKAMPPKLLSDDKQNILIRPLSYVAEKDIIAYANYKKFPIIACNLCGSQENLQRAMINDMLRDWDRAHPKRLASMFKALQNVAPSQLADRQLFDFEHLSRQMDDDVRVFEGNRIQAGQVDLLDKMGLPTSPQVQKFNAKFENDGMPNDEDDGASDKPTNHDKPVNHDNVMPYKIPIINPLV